MKNVYLNIIIKERLYDVNLSKYTSYIKNPMIGVYCVFSCKQACLAQQTILFHFA